jgi:hypothetical protein
MKSTLLVVCSTDYVLLEPAECGVGPAMLQRTCIAVRGTSCLVTFQADILPTERLCLCCLVPCQLAPACGSYLLATWLTGHLYDQAATAGGDIHACTGHDCFGPAFRILTAGSAVSTCLCVYAAVRSRGVYRLVAGHLQHVRGAATQEAAGEV